METLNTVRQSCSLWVIMPRP